MWCSRLLLLAFASVPALACDRTPTPVQPLIPAPSAALLQNEWLPFESDYVTCNGDLLGLVGQVHATSVERFSEGGTYHTRVQFSIKATATGPDGSAYNVASNSMHLVNQPPTSGGEFTWLDKVKLTGKGPAANESFTYLIRGTMNANGEVTTYRYKCTLGCINLGADNVGPDMVACY